MITEKFVKAFLTSFIILHSSVIMLLVMVLFMVGLNMGVISAIIVNVVFLILAAIKRCQIKPE